METKNSVCENETMSQRATPSNIVDDIEVFDQLWLINNKWKVVTDKSREYIIKAFQGFAFPVESLSANVLFYLYDFGPQDLKEIADNYNADTRTDLFALVPSNRRYRSSTNNSRVVLPDNVAIVTVSDMVGFPLSSIQGVSLLVEDISINAELERTFNAFDFSSIDKDRTILQYNPPSVNFGQPKGEITAWVVPKFNEINIRTNLGSLQGSTVTGPVKVMRPDLSTKVRSSTDGIVRPDFSFIPRFV